jgi:environmental stress-induced protein Ves
MTIVKAHFQKTSTWSGGQTTELAIFPFESSYQNRDFVFRISSARVEVNTSEFTSLPGYHRILMVLEGRLLIKHIGHYQIELGTYEQDSFDGGWKTISEGIATDFNVMTSEKASAKLNCQRAISGEVIQLSNQTLHHATALYWLSGKASLASNQESLEKGDFVLLEPGEQSELTICIEEDSSWVKVDILVQ